MPGRPYDAIASRITAEGSRDERMRAVVDAIWESLRDKGVSWVGFYLEKPGAGDDCRLELGPCRDKPACSPIGLHGVCGQALQFRKARIVEDVTELGDEYIACDERDRSEIALPLLDRKSGECWGVLDVDSHDVGAFSEDDARGLQAVLAAAGL